MPSRSILCLRAALGYLNGNPFSYKILHARAQNVAYHVEWPALISPAAIMAAPYTTTDKNVPVVVKACV